MMPVRPLLAAVLVLCGVRALADNTPIVRDLNGDGAFSLREIQAAYPGVTPKTFASIDTNHDGKVSPDELVAAVNKGMLKAGD